MEKFVSHQAGDGVYSVHAYHPTYLKIIRNDSTKEWHVAKEINGQWRWASRSFKQKSECLQAAKVYLEKIINDQMVTQDQPQIPFRQASAKMTRKEALDVLGLSDPVTVEAIKQAFNRFLSVVHPDRGGSNFLTVQINLAKEVLLQR